MRDVPFVAARTGPPLGSRVPATPTHTRFPNRAKRPTNFRARSKITGEEGVENGLGKEEIEERVGYAVNLLRTSHKLILNDPASKPMGLAIWQAISDIPSSHKVDFVTRLSCRDIHSLWKLAGERYTAPRAAVVSTIGPEYSLLREMPAMHGDIVKFRGRLALPFRKPVDISRLEKEFFLVPQPSNEMSDPKSGLLDSRGGGEADIVGITHLSFLLRQLTHYSAMSYFSVTLGTCIIRETLELCDMQLSYIPGLEDTNAGPRSDVSDSVSGEGAIGSCFTEYVRAAGPGVIVGVSYDERENRKDRSTFLQKLFPLPLYFVAAVDGRG